MLHGAVSLGKGIENLNQTNREQGVGLKATLVTEQMELHEQLINHAAMERRDDIGKGPMESTFAVGNSDRGAQAFNPG